MDSDVKMPRRRRKKKSQAPLMYGRHGKTELGNDQLVTLPVGLDRDAMDQLVKEAVQKDFEEQMQMMMPMM